MERLTEITADDVIRAGACVSGVYEVLERFHPKIAASIEVSYLLSLLKTGEKKYVIAAAMLDGDGDGDGYGYGYGYGDGNGNGYGYGYGYGNGESD